MKKILSAALAALLLVHAAPAWTASASDTSRKPFSIRTTLPASKQASYRNQVDKVLKGFDSRLEAMDEDDRLAAVDRVLAKLDEILKRKLSAKNKYVFSYIDYRLELKREEIRVSISMNVDNSTNDSNNVTTDNSSVTTDNSVRDSGNVSNSNSGNRSNTTTNTANSGNSTVNSHNTTINYNTVYNNNSGNTTNVDNSNRSSNVDNSTNNSNNSTTTDNSTRDSNNKVVIGTVCSE